MLAEQFYERLEKSRYTFLLFATLNILFFSGISFTFVIPGLKGFSLFFVVLTLLMYLIAANISSTSINTFYASVQFVKLEETLSGLFFVFNVSELNENAYKNEMLVIYKDTVDFIIMHRYT